MERLPSSFDVSGIRTAALDEFLEFMAEQEISEISLTLTKPILLGLKQPECDGQ
jgi:hypothetical protein